jgi:adenylate kinase
MLSEGRLIPDELIAESIEKELKRRRETEQVSGFILDGFPRTLAQAGLLDSITDIDCALNISLARWVMIGKLKGRLVCRGCGDGFNECHVDEAPYRMPAIKQDKSACAKGIDFCTECGVLDRRLDDTDDVIARRLKLYEDTFHPIVEHYQRKNKLKNFDVLTGVDDTPAIIELLLAPPTLPL